MMWTSCVAYILQGTESEWGLTSLEVGFLGSCFPLGNMFGSFIWGFIADRYGRMYSFKNTVLLAAFSSALLAFSMNFYMACFSLMLLGAGMGGEISLGGTVFCEFCPPSKMFHLATLAIFWALGGVLIALIALITVMENDLDIQDWRIIVASGFVIECFGFIFRYFMKETPAFLLVREDFSRAEEVLNDVSMQNTRNPFHLPLQQQKLNMSSTSSKNYSKTKFFKLFKEKNISKILLFAIVIYKKIYFTASFAFIGILFFMPVFLDNLTTVESYGIILLQQMCSVPGVLLASYLIETRLGRRYTIVLGLCLSSMCCFVFYIEANLISVLNIQVVIVTSFFNLLIEMAYSALYTITTESFSTEIRNTGVAFASVWARMGSISSPLVTAWLLSQKNGFPISLALFAGLIAIGSFAAIFLKETRIKQNNSSLIKN